MIVERWRLDLVTNWDENGDPLEWIVGEKEYQTQAEAEFAMISAQRAMKNCGFNVWLSLVKTFNHIENER